MQPSTKHDIFCSSVPLLLTLLDDDDEDDGDDNGDDDDATAEGLIGSLNKCPAGGESDKFKSTSKDPAAADLFFFWGCEMDPTKAARSLSCSCFCCSNSNSNSNSNSSSSVESQQAKSLKSHSITTTTTTLPSSLISSFPRDERETHRHKA